MQSARKSNQDKASAEQHMELVNVTRKPGAYSIATDKTGQVWLFIVTKASYGFPIGPTEEPLPLDDQAPLVMTDEFTGEPGFSAIRAENDFAPRKPRCDVLLIGCCYAPNGRPAKRVRVSLQVGTMTKFFDVVGNRFWEPDYFLGVAPSQPETFTVMPISYDNAYGGVDEPTPDPLTHSWYPTNHVGLGFRPRTAPERLSGEALPNTEEERIPISEPNGNYRPMAFGPLGRSWRQRIKWGGTYDDSWRKTKYPFLPDDFDDRYFQSAPEDQQVDYLKGGEKVVMVNLTPHGRVEFRLPKFSEPITIVYKSGERRRISSVVDTLMLEPELKRFSLSQRASLHLRRNAHEILKIELGPVFPQPLPEDGEQQIAVAKPRYKSLSDLIAAQRATRHSREGTRR